MRKEYRVRTRYNFRAPDGMIHEIINLKKFCREHDLGYDGMGQLASPKKSERCHSYKGWTFISRTNRNGDTVIAPLLLSGPKKRGLNVNPLGMVPEERHYKNRWNFHQYKHLEFLMNAYLYSVCFLLAILVWSC